MEDIMVNIDNLLENVQISGKGEPIVFLNGFGFDNRCYSGIIDSLSEHFYVVAIDLIGTNRLKNPPTTTTKVVNLINQITENLKLDKYQIVGHSAGGLVALKLATQNNKIYRGVVINPVIQLGTNPIGAMGVVYARQVTGILQDYFKQTLDLITNGDTELSVKAAGLQAIYTENVSRNNDASLKLGINFFLEDYSEINVDQPFLAILGTADEIFDYNTGINPLLTHVPNLEIITKEHERHQSLVYYPERYIDDMMEFLK